MKYDEQIMTREDMTKEEELLLQELCARLPYGVIVYGNYRYGSGDEIFDDEKVEVLNLSKLDWFFNGIEVKPYLRSIPNLTGEEQFQLGRLMADVAITYKLLNGDYSSLKELLEYVYKNHIDLFGLIPKGLALEAPEGMY